MRKNTARKWVHLLLDLLPVLIIPIFAIYLINHNPQGLQVETGGWEVQEKYQTNEVNNVDDIVIGNIYHCDEMRFNDVSMDYGRYFFQIYILRCEKFLVDSDYPVIDDINVYEYNANFNNNIQVSFNDINTAQLVFSNLNGYIATFFENGYDLYFSNFDFIINYDEHNILPYLYNDTFDINISDFNVYEYTYNEGIIYDNTDIGSQLIYSMYIPVHDYFNMTGLFNFGDIYTWINNSMFSGNAPLPIFIVYNVIVYEFLIDLIFLIYSIFMFLIDFSSELLARCFSFSNKGGTR